jgi:hypothetical protein
VKLGFEADGCFRWTEIKSASPDNFLKFISLHFLIIRNESGKLKEATKAK